MTFREGNQPEYGINPSVVQAAWTPRPKGLDDPSKALGRAVTDMFM